MRRAATVVLTCLATLCQQALGQLGERDALTPVVANLPLETRLVVVSSRPSAVLEAMKGPLRSLPFTAGVGTDTLRSWSVLTRELGYEPGEGFEALTSGGLALVVMRGSPADEQGADARPQTGGTLQVGVSSKGGVNANVVVIDGGMPRWAVVSVVRAEVAGRLRERLRAAPKDVVGGRAVLSVEGGKFLLVCRPLAGVAEARELVAVAPSGDNTLLEALVGAVEGAGGEGRRADRLAGTAAFARASDLSADVTVMVDESERAGWTETTVLGCATSSTRWVMEGYSEGPRVRVGPVPGRIAGVYEAWVRRSALAVCMGEIDGLTFSQDGAAGAPRLRGVAVCVVAPRAGEDASLPRTGGRALMAAQVHTVGAGLMPMVDGVMCNAGGIMVRGDWIERLRGGAGDRAEADASVFAGLDDDGVRRLALRAEPLSPVSGLIGVPIAGGSRPATVCWWSNQVEQDDRMVVACLHASEQASQQMQAGVAPEPAPIAGQPRAWVWRASVRPGELVNALPSQLGLVVGLSGVGTIKGVTGEAWREGGVVRSRVEVEWGGVK